MRRHPRRDFLTSLGLGAAALMAPRFAWSQTPQRKPNIIFILMDDMGWMDSTPYGSRYFDSPALERLARRGMLFTDAYAANPLCSPTRASIITGKYPARFNITTPVCHLPPDPKHTDYAKEGPPHARLLFPVSNRFLPLDEYTIAEALRDAGYKTCHVGKWHLGVTRDHWPETQGFETAVHGKPDPGPPNYFSPYGFKEGTITDGPAGEYITDRLTDEALKFIEANRDKPFFLNFWHHAVHSPWQGKEELMKKWADKRDSRGKQASPVMAAMLKSGDESLGRLLDKLDELKLADNTIIVFFSDNGGVDFPIVKEGARTPPPGSPRAKMIEEYRKWAGDEPPTSNYPLRGGKATVWEGGTRVPCLVVWPGVVQAGSKCCEVVSSVDFYPTILEMLGLAPKPAQVLDGVSIVPLLKQAGKLDREAIFCHFPHSMGERSPAATWVRKGDWKLIRVYDTALYTETHYLFNLKEDLGETKNLAASMPDKVKELDALIDRFLKETNALTPIPNPKYDPVAALMGGWKDNTKGASVEDGILKVQCDGDKSFLGNASFSVFGEAVFKLRARSNAGGPGKMTWRTANLKDFNPKHVVTFDLPADGQWHEVEVRLPVQGNIVHARLYPAGKPGIVEIDWIRLYAGSGPDAKLEREWTFDKK